MHISDQLGREYRWENTPKCIVSLVPSITELLFDLGLQEQVVGVTKFCVHPENSRKEKTIVGGTKNLRMDVISKLQPDLIMKKTTGMIFFNWPKNFLFSSVMYRLWKMPWK